MLGVLVLVGAGEQMGLLTFLKCLATIWGILLLIIFMGYSMAEIPKTMWYNSDPKRYLDYLYHKTVEMSAECD